MTDQKKPLTSDLALNIVQGIILSLVTCGLYNIYWNYKQMEALNRLLGRQEYNFVTWLVLSVVTCGIYHIYFEYKMGSDLKQVMHDNGYQVNDNLAVIGLILSVFGMSIVCDAVYQNEINKLCP
jgi:hypothetical protein